jgi:hypothetical protein
MRKIYVILKKLKLCIKGIHFSRLKREITNVKRMISELKSKMCEWYITEWIRDFMMYTQVTLYVTLLMTYAHKITEMFEDIKK